MSAPAVLDAPPSAAPQTSAGPGRTAPAWTPRPIPAGQAFRIDGVTWTQYVAIADALPNRNVCVTYDRGSLQLMTTGNAHENLKMVLHHLLIGCDDVCNVPLSCLGNVTLRRETFDRGFEPDNCYYVDTDVAAFEGLGPDELPAPDLAVEVEVSNDVLARLPSYAAVGVGEVWRVDGQTGPTFLRLEGGPGGAYLQIPESGILPGVTPDLVWEAVTTVPQSRSVSRYVKALTEFLRSRLAGE
jgi:Uma2 family endonuclease